MIGIAYRASRLLNCSRKLTKTASGITNNASVFDWPSLANAMSSSCSLLAGRTLVSNPNRRAAICASATLGSAFALCGLTKKPTTPAFGSSSRNNSTRFGPSWLAIRVTPVTFPPGRLRLSTNPIATGSLAVMKTIGIVAVAPFATKVGTSLIVKITLARSRIKPSASAGTRSRRVSAQRYSIATSLPSAKPAAAIPSTNAAVNCGGVAEAYPGPEKSDCGHLRLLGARRNRPCRHRAAEKRAVSLPPPRLRTRHRSGLSQNWERGRQVTERPADVRFGSVADIATSQGDARCTKKRALRLPSAN